MPHQAGLDGNGGSSYIDLVVCRNKDANTAWTSASDGTLEERLYYCQNWRADVSVIVTSSGTMKEWVKYSAYGVPFGVPGGDTDSDGDCDGTDVTQVQTWVTGSHYDPRADINLDGVVDVGNDKTTINSSFNGITLGRGNLSAIGVASRKGCAGYESALGQGIMYSVRHRVLVISLGRWNRRDPMDYADGLDLYQVCRGMPVIHMDPMGAEIRTGGGIGPDGRTGVCPLDGDGEPGGCKLPGPPDRCGVACEDPLLLGRVMCSEDGGVMVCLCIGNINNTLGAGASKAARTAARHAVTEHEQAHADSGVCIFGLFFTMCGHPCAYDAELIQWEKELRGPCTGECKEETRNLRRNACNRASPGARANSPACSDT